MKNTKAVDGRRTLSFNSLGDVLADVQSFDAPAVESVGNWSPSQIVSHVDKVIVASVDGFDFKAPIVLRLLGPFMRGMIARPIKAGFKIPASARRTFEPDPDVTWDEAVAGLRRSVQRVQDGAAMDKSSPIFGAMSPDDWVNLHCRHAELHFGFLRRAEG